MSVPTIEERVTQLEAEMGQVKLALQPTTRRKNPWATFGLMAGSKRYDEIVRLGAEYRRQDHERAIQEQASESET